MTTLCENCDEMTRLQKLEVVLERLRDKAQIAIVADCRREHARGYKSAWEDVIKLIDEKAK